MTFIPGRAPIASPTFTGNPTGPAPSAADDDTSLPTTAWVNDAIAAATPGYVGVLARHSTTQSINDITTTALNFDTEIFDSHGFHDTVTNNTRFTVPSGQAGKYSGFALVEYAVDADGDRLLIIRKNGSTSIAVAGGRASTVNNVTAVVCTFADDLVAGDYVEALAYHQAGNALNSTVTGNRAPRFFMKRDDPVGIGSAAIGQDSAASTIYVATTGSDTTGTGSSGAPYATVAKALSTLPRSIGFLQTIDVADGTYAEAINLSGFVCTGGGKILITGNTTTPANVSFTGTLTDNGSTIVAFLLGQVKAELEGVRVNATADYGVVVNDGADLIIDRCTLTGTLGTAVHADNGRGRFMGNNTLSGFSTRGLGLFNKAIGGFTSAGTLTITGPGSTGIGVHMGYGSVFPILTASTNITITGVLEGFHGGLNSSFQHLGATSTITIDNASTPGSSNAIICTDNSGWAVSGPAVVIDNFTDAFEANSLSYIEHTGSRTITNVTNTEVEGFGGRVELL